MAKLEEGELVCLKTGGPLMTVEHLADTDTDLISCVWMVDGLIHRDSFHINHLNHLIKAEDK